MSTTTRHRRPRRVRPRAARAAAASAVGLTAVALVTCALAGGGPRGQALGMRPVAPPPLAAPRGIELVLLLDSSASMRAFFPNRDGGDERRDAIVAVARDLPTGSHLTVVEFDDDAHVILPRTALVDAASRDAAARAVGALEDDGGTDFDVAVALALTELGGHSTELVGAELVLFTDGLGELGPVTLERLRGAGVRVHTIGLGPGVDGARLAALAETTGGRHHPVATTAELVGVFRGLVAEVGRSGVRRAP